MTKLDLGSGPILPREGYTSVDLYVPADVKDDIRYLREFDADSVDEIYCSHALEHIARRDVPITLFNWHRALVPGGQVEIIVPDLPNVMREWLKAYDAGKDVWSFYVHSHQTLDAIFGIQENEGEFHKSGFDTAYLEQLLHRAGFCEVEVESIWNHRQPCLKATAVKPREA